MNNYFYLSGQFTKQSDIFQLPPNYYVIFTTDNIETITDFSKYPAFQEINNYYIKLESNLPSTLTYQELLTKIEKVGLFDIPLDKKMKMKTILKRLAKISDVAEIPNWVVDSLISENNNNILEKCLGKTISLKNLIYGHSLELGNLCIPRKTDFGDVEFEENDDNYYFILNHQLSQFHEKKGNLLDSDAKYIVHQTSCQAKHAKYLSEKVFKQFPYADVYSSKRNCELGTIIVKGNGINERYVIALFGQNSVNKPTKKETKEQRFEWFKEGLMKISQIKNLNSIDFPGGIGCGAGGGDWNKYRQSIIDFSKKVDANVGIIYLDDSFLKPKKIEFIKRKKESDMGTVYIAAKKMRGAWAPRPANVQVLDVTSAQGKASATRRDFSPMSPIPGRYKEFYCFENYWQSGKIFEGFDEKKIQKHVGWWKNLEEGKRRYPGSKDWKVLHSDYDGKIRDYVTSRKEVYVPEYYELMKDTPSFQKMKALVESGKDVVVYDFDGPRQPNGDNDILEVSLDMLKEKINAPRFPFGHGYVVAAALAGINPDKYTM
jgi:hypothetical protein